LSPSDGVPGLIKYCVYPASAADDGSVTVLAVGDNLAAWKDDAPPQFAFVRPDGNPSNIGLDGRADYVMGTASWTAGAPANQIVLLHINDPAECTKLYGSGGDPDAGTVGTCWVFPGSQQQAPPAAGLTASSDGRPAFSHTFDWSIQKSVDSHHQNIPDGDTATFNYTVTVTKGAGSDGGWQVTGTIQAFNPNGAGDDVTGVVVTDAINDPNASCSVTGGVNATIAGLGSKSFAYSCSYTAAPASSSQTNTATVTWPTQTLADGSSLSGNSTTSSAPIDWSTTTPAAFDNCTNIADSNPDTTVAGPICATT